MVIGAIYATMPSNEIKTKRKKELLISCIFEQFLIQNSWAREALFDPGLILSSGYILCGVS